MRTTLTLEPDVAAKLKELAHRRRTSFKVVVNEVLRRGLTAPESSGDLPPFVVRPHDLGGFLPGVDPDKLNQFLDDEDVEEFRRKFVGEFDTGSEP